MFSNTKSYLSYLKKIGEDVNIKDSGKIIPIVTNLIDSEASVCHLLKERTNEEIRQNLLLLESFLETNEDVSGAKRLFNIFKLKRLNKYFPRRYSGTAPCHESVQYTAKLYDLPFIKSEGNESSIGINDAVIFSNDPTTGKRIIESFPIHILSDKTISVAQTENSGLEHNISECTHALPVVICIGGNPLLNLIAKSSFNIDKLALIGLLQSEPVMMTSALTQTVMIPAESDIVIEGYIKKSGDRVEFGIYQDDNGIEHNSKNCPVINVSCITHRRDAILTTSYGKNFLKAKDSFDKILNTILPPFISIR